MKGIVQITAVVFLGLLVGGCASTRTAGQNPFPYDPWYADLVPLSKDRVTDWSLLDLGYPNLPDLNDTENQPLYDLKMLFK